MPIPSDLHCQAAALRHAARRVRKRSIVTELLTRARRLEVEAVLLERRDDQLTFNDSVAPPKVPEKV